MLEQRKSSVFKSVKRLQTTVHVGNNQCKGMCLKCSLNEPKRVDPFTWKNNGLLLQVLMQHKLICIEVYLHSALTHSNVTFFLPASLPVWSLHVIHALCPSRLCGNGRPAVHHTPRQTSSQTGVQKTTVALMLAKWNMSGCVDWPLDQRHTGLQKAL